jgi:hypothetical protein
VDRRRLEINRLIKGLGLRLGSTNQSGGHIKAVITKGDISKNVIFPVSPSDSRWKKNMESYLRKTFDL